MSKTRHSTTAFHRSGGFTLIEVLIVVVIMAVLAGTIISRYLSTADDAKQSAMTHNLSVLETQFEVYRAQHLGAYPAITNNGLPQLTSSTDAAGNIGIPGSQYPYGPYILESPRNPYDGSAKVTPVAVPGQKPSGIVGDLGGWLYDQANGAIWPNNPECYQ